MKLRSKLFLFFLLATLVCSCDYSSSLDKEIIAGQKAFKEQDYLKATKIYQEVVKKTNNRELKRKLLYRISEILLVEIRDVNSSLGSLNELLSNENDLFWQVKAREKIADINFSYKKNYKEAVYNYHLLSNYKPPLEGVDFYKYRHALALLMSEDYTTASAAFNEIYADKKSTYRLEALFYSAQIKFLQSKWEEAITLYKDYLTQESDAEKIIQAKFLIANCYEMIPKLKEAYNIYYAILEKYPNQDVILRRLKSIYERRRNRKR
jgi:TolA-binding protein